MAKKKKNAALTITVDIYDKHIANYLTVLKEMIEGEGEKDGYSYVINRMVSKNYEGLMTLKMAGMIGNIKEGNA